MNDPLFEVHCACVRFINAGHDALEEKFVTNDDDLDDPGARLAILQSVSAVRELLSHLDGTFEFANGQAELKEGDSCHG